MKKSILGWKINGDFNIVKKSILIIAPHTSYWDAIIGKILLLSTGMNHRILSKKELFFFPMNLLMYSIGAIPVRGVNGCNAIYEVCRLIKENDSLHIVICPEGGFSPTEKWDPGFYYMALKSQVPIMVGYLDYAKKEVGIKGIITDLSNKDNVFIQVAEYYKDVTACYPEKFKLPQIKSSTR